MLWSATNFRSCGESHKKCLAASLAAISLVAFLFWVKSPIVTSQKHLFYSPINQKNNYLIAPKTNDRRIKKRSSLSPSSLCKRCTNNEFQEPLIRQLIDRKLGSSQGDLKLILHNSSKTKEENFPLKQSDILAELHDI